MNHHPSSVNWETSNNFPGVGYFNGLFIGSVSMGSMGSPNLSIFRDRFVKPINSLGCSNKYSAQKEGSILLRSRWSDLASRTNQNKILTLSL